MLKTNEKPLISVIIEGYNESVKLGEIEDTVNSLRQQDFPLDQVEIILVGSEAQASGWKEMYAGEKSFFAVKAVGADNAHYYELKNIGAANATADILALVDADVTPNQNWLSIIYQGITQNGAEAVAGISLFHDKWKMFSTHSSFLLSAASISWGFVVPHDTDQPQLIPNAFLSHNLGVRADVFQQHRYREDLGRTCAGSFLFNSLLESGTKMSFQLNQRVEHNFTLWWWLSRLHFRSGYEIYQLRRIDPRYPNKTLAKMSFVEPLATWFWNVIIDVPRWFRFSKVLKIGKLRQILLLPLLVVLSFFARGAEMIGMFTTIFLPERMKHFAEKS